MRRYFTPLLAALPLALAVACSEEPTGPAPSPPPTPWFRIGSIENFGPNQTATIHGGLFETINSFTVGGQPVALELVNDSVATFTVPGSLFRECETDGRPIQLSAKGYMDRTVTFDARVEVENTVQMEVGESRILKPSDLHCMQIAAADEDYVLTALNTEIVANTVPRTLLTYRTWTAGENEPTPFGQRIPDNHAPSYPYPIPPGSEGYYPPDKPAWTGNPTLFDPAYSTAQVGDTVRFVDWSKINPSCREPIPEHAVRITVVAAVEGKTAPRYQAWVRGSSSLPAMR